MFAFDVIEEILLRSDAKDLVPWKRVCKSWYSLISSTRFHKAHLKMINSNELRIAMPSYWKIPNARLYEHNKWKVAGSSNGLVCLYRIDEKVSLILLSNPCTREVRRLPMSPFVPERHQYMGGICLSFAYDSSTDDYKVVMEIKKSIDVALIQVLSLRSNTWKLIGEFSYAFMRNMPGILLHGALHWVVFDYTTRNLEYTEKIIVSFDLSREEFKVFPQPNHSRFVWHSRRGLPIPGIVDDQICIFFANKDNNLPRDVWVMRSYNVQHSWEPLPNNYPMKHVAAHHMKMVEFDSPKNKRMSFFYDDDKCLSRACKYIIAHRFVPSLVSPYAATRPSHAKHNKTSVKSWSIQVVKGEGQHSQAMLRRTIVKPSEREARMIEELYRQEVGETENLYLHEDESREIVTICAERGMKVERLSLFVQKEEEGGQNKEKEE